MLKKSKRVLSIVFAISMLTGTVAQATLSDAAATLIHNLIAGIGWQSGKNIGDHLWQNHKKELLIGSVAVIAIWYWKTTEDKKKQKHQHVHVH